MPSKRTPQQEPVLTVVARRVGRAAGTLTHMAETLVLKPLSQATHSSPAEKATAAKTKPKNSARKKSQTIPPMPTRQKARPKGKAASTKKKAASKPRARAKRLG
jgi:hypothetical protein